MISFSLDLDKVADAFTYHPPQSQEDIDRHKAVNDATIAYAQALSKVIQSPAKLTVLFGKIQDVRMLADQAIAYDRVGFSIRDIFEMGIEEMPPCVLGVKREDVDRVKASGLIV